MSLFLILFILPKAHMRHFTRAIGDMSLQLWNQAHELKHWDKEWMGSYKDQTNNLIDDQSWGFRLIYMNPGYLKGCKDKLNI